MRSTFWYDTDSDCDIEYEFKLEQVDPLSDNAVSNKSLKEIWVKNLNRIVLAHFSINSLRNKFDILTRQITGNVEVLVISETKVEDSSAES